MPKKIRELKNLLLQLGFTCRPLKVVTLTGIIPCYLGELLYQVMMEKMLKNTKKKTLIMQSKE